MKLPKQIADELEASGLPWEIVKGSKHHKIMMDGTFVSILPMGRKAKLEHGRERRMTNCVLHIRRFIKAKQESKK